MSDDEDWPGGFESPDPHSDTSAVTRDIARDRARLALESAADVAKRSVIGLGIVAFAIGLNAVGLAVITALGFVIANSGTFPYVTAMAWVAACIWMAPINLVLAWVVLR